MPLLISKRRNKYSVDNILVVDTGTVKLESNHENINNRLYFTRERLEMIELVKVIKKFLESNRRVLDL